MQTNQMSVASDKLDQASQGAVEAAAATSYSTSVDGACETVFTDVIAPEHGSPSTSTLTWATSDGRGGTVVMREDNPHPPVGENGDPIICIN